MGSNALNPTLSQAQALQVQNYTYTLPLERIAAQPLPQRDASRLAVYHAGKVVEDVFSNLPQHLPGGALLIANNTRVVPARLHFPLGERQHIEVLCLAPLAPHKSVDLAMQARGHTRWQCMLGGARRWKDDQELEIHSKAGRDLTLYARKGERLDEGFTVDLRWQPIEITFAEVLEHLGHIPLPPYIKRPDNDDDRRNYQTVYAQQAGAVAAPTAGLHFTPAVLAALTEKSIRIASLTLHVGAGTFKPVSAEYMAGHAMHQEEVHVTQEVVRLLIQELSAKQKRNPIIAVGTTSLRTLESLYWFGAELLHMPQAQWPATMFVGQWQPYEFTHTLPEPAAALSAILAWLDLTGQPSVHGNTQLLIVPGYSFQLADALITNFHQPQSTLLLLVAAFIGPDWHRVYDYALANHFRFLSYGDGSLLWRNTER